MQQQWTRTCWNSRSRWHRHGDDSGGARNPFRSCRNRADEATPSPGPSAVGTSAGALAGDGAGDVGIDGAGGGKWRARNASPPALVPAGTSVLPANLFRASDGAAENVRGAPERPQRQRWGTPSLSVRMSSLRTEGWGHIGCFRLRLDRIYI
eukprot:m.1318544 g.1318544  ORF g.1318544 m.1318544 type:complete len:152 (+) comp24841_c0_seq39:1890-2345(+)